MKAWQVVRHGPPREALALRDLPVPEPGPGQLRLATRATALNFNEVDGCYGRYRTVDPPLPYTLGMEAVGEVEAVGDPELETWRGRRVMATGAGATGAHAEHVIADAAMVFEAPEALDDAEAAAFFFPFHVAWLSLVERGALAKGETALVHAAAGGVGSAAVQVARARGARVIATAGSDEKCAYARELGADLAIDYRAGDFAAAVLDATQGRGVDVICDLVGGEVMSRSLPCLARGGRLVLTGFSGGIAAEDEAGLVPRPIVFANASILGVLLAYVPDGTPERAGLGLLPRRVGERVQGELVRLLEAGAIRPQPRRRSPATELPAELERLERREVLGRSVLLW